MMNPDEWDWASHKRRTAKAVEDMKREARLEDGRPVAVTFLFVPAVEGARPGAFMEALTREGLPNGIEEATEKRPKALIATADLDFSYEQIWAEEEKLTRIGMEYGFGPIGWNLAG